MRKRALLLGVLLLSAITLFGADATYDGAKVHYESYGTGKDAIVFIHGWTCDLTFWRGQAPVYLKHRSLLIDLPGHGQSAKPEVAYTQERFARAIDAVMRDAGVDRAIIVGHSMGGPVALTFLRLFPQKTAGIVFVDALLPEASRTPAQVDQMTKSWRAPDYKKLFETAINSMFSPATIPGQKDDIREKMLSTPQYVVVSAMEGMWSLVPPKDGESYTVPAAAIMVKRANAVGYEGRLRRIFTNLQKYEEWDGAGHFLMMEDPVRFNASLEAFLKVATPKSLSLSSPGIRVVY